MHVISPSEVNSDDSTPIHTCSPPYASRTYTHAGQYLELVLQKSMTGKVRRLRVPVSISGCVGVQLEKPRDDHSVWFFNVDELNNGPLVSYIVLDIHDVTTKYDIMCRTEPNGPLELYPAIQHEVAIPTDTAGYQPGPVGRGTSESTAIVMRERSQHLEKQLKAAMASGRPLWVPKGGQGMLTGGGAYRWIVNWKTVAAASAGAALLFASIGTFFPYMKIQYTKTKSGTSFLFEANALKTRSEETKDVRTAADSLPADKKPSSIDDAPGLQGPHLMFVMEDENISVAAA